MWCPPARQAHPRTPSRAIKTSAVIGGVFLGAMFVGTVAFALLKVVEQDQQPDRSGDAPSVSVSIRPVRVLIGSALERIRVTSTARLVVGDAGGRTPAEYPADTSIECAARGVSVMVNGQENESPVTIESSSGSSVSVALFRRGDWTEPREYPGLLRVTATADSGLSVINEVDIEPYVACVTANEVWPGFEEQTFRVQAIVARTYVLHQMRRRKNEAFDVSATQSSQVYRGIRRDTTGINAARAAEFTRGLVLTWFDGIADRVFCSYYCAACGGRTQSAAIFGIESDIEPLSGGVACDYCRIAPGETYRWGSVRLSLDEVFRRVVARDADLSALEPLRSITMADATDDGRAISIRLTGADGTTEDMLAERFRLAVGASEIRSTHFSLRREGQFVVFENGKGFGHGLGLCQWGAEGQARQGRSAGAILRYYYPGAKLTRVY